MIKRSALACAIVWCQSMDADSWNNQSLGGMRDMAGQDKTSMKSQ